MCKVKFRGRKYDLKPGETLLDGLLRQNEEVPYSCKGGACKMCMLRSIEGPAPKGSQSGLKSTLVAQGYFLACQCVPNSDMSVVLTEEAVLTFTMARVLEKTLLNSEILRLRFELPSGYSYRPGQFAQFVRPDGLGRTYSIASIPQVDDFLEFHVRRLPNGKMSEWLHDKLKVGDTLRLSSASGDCFYEADALGTEPILLIGTGSGLAPLYGVARDALNLGHQGDIKLYHGSLTPDGLYLRRELAEMAETYTNFCYVPCANDQAGSGVAAGRADENALCSVSSLKGWRVFLCGNPAMVSSARKRAFLLGASLNSIYADPFVLTLPNTV